MIGRGRFNDIFLYEVTKQDLMIGETASDYRVGSILMFADKKAVALGAELARADDIDSAKVFLQQKERLPVILDVVRNTDAVQPDLQALLADKDETLRGLTEKIEQRDELLLDISETLKNLKSENELLHLQLTQAREQLVVDELVRNELVDDLQNASKDTHTIESTLGHVLEEKFNLEQELAEKITDLVELNLQNDELKRQLANPISAAATQAASSSNGKEPSARYQSTSTETEGGSDTASHILTMSSGKQIHVFHEFPDATKPGRAASARRVVLFLLKTLGSAILVLSFLFIVSIAATAAANSITCGEALDLIAGKLKLPIF